MDYYIDGTIGSIEVALGNNSVLHFSLIPASEHIKTVIECNCKTGKQETKSKALFIGKEGSRTALLEALDKDQNAKDCLRFIMPNMSSLFRLLLLEAKNNRNTVRVTAKTNNVSGKPEEELRVDFDQAVDITIL